MGWVYWIVAIILKACGADIEASFWMLMAVVSCSAQEVVNAIRKDVG